MKVEVKDNQSLMDLAMLHYNSAEALPDLLNDNPSINLNDGIDKGLYLVVSESNIRPIVSEVLVVVYPNIYDKKIIVQDNQNPIDLAIQYYGSAEGIKYLLNDNQDYRIDSPPPKGSVIRINKSNVIDKQMIKLIEKLGLIVSTGVEFVAQSGNFWVDEDGNNVVDENDNFVITE